MVPSRSADAAQPELSLEDATDLWNSRGVTDYAFVYRRLCFCNFDFVRPVRMVVQGGQISDARYADGSDASSERRQTIAGVLAEVRAWAADTPHAFSFTADPDWGYPLSASVDRRQSIADDETLLEVTCFSPSTQQGACPISPADDLPYR